MALISILLLYLGIGVLAAVGTVTITRKRFSAATERRFFALLLLPVAAIYLAFVTYFQSPSSLRYETLAVSGFVLLGLLGTRIRLLLILGYVLHGGWDLAHEVVTYIDHATGSAAVLTPIPLAYGLFCAAYDWCIAAYIGTRRQTEDGAQ